MRLLIAEADRRAGAYLQRALAESGHVIDLAKDGETALNLGTEYPFDAVILARALPALDGLATARRLRAEGCNAPILMLGPGTSEPERVEGLAAGCDDYLAAPYALAELLARLDALTRYGDHGGTVLKVGDLELNLPTRSATRAGRPLRLTHRELSILHVLMERVGAVVTRTELMEALWDLEFDPQSAVIDAHVYRLRKKLDDGFDTPMIGTVPGVGYRLQP